MKKPYKNTRVPQIGLLVFLKGPQTVTLSRHCSVFYCLLWSSCTIIVL